MVTGIAKLLLQQGLKQGSKRFAQPLRGAYQNNPYFKNYAEMMTGQQGWKKGAAAWYGTDYAMDTVSDLMLPERTQEDVVIPAEDLGPPQFPKDGPVDMPPDVVKKPKIIETPDKKDTSNKKIIEEENEMKDEALSANGNAIDTNTATVAATDSAAAASIDNDSVDRVKMYKDIVKEFVGNGDEGARMQKGALLMQVGGALLAGKSDDPGVRGFVDIIGKTAMQTAPMLFQMGVEQGKADREIGQAALQMYISERDKLNDRSGDFVAVWANDYEKGAGGEIVYDAYTGAPKINGRRLVGQYRANSPEMNWFLDQNNAIGYPGYTFQPSSGTAAGVSGLTMPGDDSSMMITDAGKDSMLKSARYINSALVSMANNIMPTMIENKDTLIGVSGWFGQKVGPAAYVASELVNGFKSAWGPNSISQITDDEFKVNRDSKLGEYYRSLIPGTAEGNAMDNNVEGGMTYAVMEGQSYVNGVAQTMSIGGNDVPVFIDNAGKYGKKGAAYVTRGGLEKILFDPRRGQLSIFETTLGLALARNRQPTGRMLADVLKRSFEETSTRSLFGQSNMPQVVIGNYMNIYNELYQGMSSQLHAAGYIPNEESRTNAGQRLSSMYTIPGSQNMANIYYNLRRNDPSYSTYGFDIQGPGIPSFESFVGGNTAVVSADDQQTGNNLNDVFDYNLKLYD